MASYLPAGMPIPVPVPDGLDAPFHQGLLEHRLLIPRCSACGNWQWPPEVLCFACRRFDVGWEEVEPVGVVFTWTRIWHPVRPQLVDTVPYLAVVVELPQAGGVRLIGNLLGDGHESVQCGAAVRGVYEDHEGEPVYTLLQWQRSLG